MPDSVTLVGLDFGSTTSNCVVGSARLARGALGRVELTDVRARYRSELVFTPVATAADDALDLVQIEQLLDRWLAEAAVDPAAVFGGGALLTGLAAEKSNAAALPALVRRRLGDVLVASIRDPHLESWLAYLGSVGDLARSHPETAILNLDIGGGTTNPAWGRGGSVTATACYSIGARHWRFEPGGYQLLSCTRCGRAVFDRLGIRRAAGERLSAAEIDGLVDLLVSNLGAIVAGREVDEVFRPPDAPPRFTAAAQAPDSALTFSGGVGELIYAHRAGAPWPASAAFGDLGVDLAKRIVPQPWADVARCRFTPPSAGRATAWGLLRHATEVSGSTLYLPTPEILPLSEVPIVGRLHPQATDAHWRTVLDLAARQEGGAAVALAPADPSAESVRALGMRLAGILRAMPYPARRPLVLLVEGNFGKTLGSSAADWGRLPVTLIAIDEVGNREAQFVRIGAPRDQVVPISFFGLRSGA